MGGTRFGKKLPLTVGIKGALHKHLVFIDADCYPSSNQWLKKIIANYLFKYKNKTKVLKKCTNNPVLILYRNYYIIVNTNKAMNKLSIKKLVQQYSSGV